MANNPSAQTADATYQARRVAITNLLDSIRLSLDEHAVEQSADPRNWGFAGDLGEVEDRLKSILRHLTNADS